MRIIAIFTLALVALGQRAQAEAEAGRIHIPAGKAIVGAQPADLADQLKDTEARYEWYKDETPKREEALPEFFIDKTEVTNERYKTIFPDHTFPPNLASHPVVNVTWAKANEFCAQSGGRLPSEAEFELAARGPSGQVYPWGNQFSPDKAMFMGSTGASRLKVGSFVLEQSGENMTGGTAPVGSFPEGASGFGALDMAGNVWEWQDGWYDEKRKLRLLKGGSWLSPQASLRSSARLADDGARLYNDYGFRCVYVPQIKK